MKFYRISLELFSPLVTIPKGDTIWGHFVWGIANHEGDEAVSGFLEECKTPNPPLVISSFFPKGTICRTIPEPKERFANLSAASYSNIKKDKKVKYISAAEYFEDKRGSESFGKIFVENDIVHNLINRISGTAEEGGIFSVQELWTVNKCFEIYVLSTYEKNRVLELTEWAFENGFGADASTGKGHVKILGIEEVKCAKNGTKYVALAPFISGSGKIKNLRADIFVRSGKIGGSFVSNMSPYKKTVILFDEGAVFESDIPIQFVGNIICDIHSDKRICQSGFAPVVPIE